MASRYPAQSVARELIVEKEDRLREAMRMMGMPSWINWTGWFLKWWLQYLLLSVVITMLFSAGNLLLYSSPLVILSMIQLLVTALIAFGFMMCVAEPMQSQLLYTGNANLIVYAFGGVRSTLFSTSNVGGACTAIMWLLLNVPYWIYSDSYYQLSTAQKTTICLSPPACLNVAFKIVA